jgi:L-rhamnose mutarotase
MLAALRAAGWGNYSLFLRADGLLVGHLTTDDFPAAQAAMERTDVNGRWQAEMAQFFLGGRPDHQMQVLDEVFDLEAQLERGERNGDLGRPS